MTRIQRLMKLHRLMEPAGENGEQQGGAAPGSGDSGAGASQDGNASGAGDKGDGDQGGSAADNGNASGDNKSKPSDADAKLIKDVMKHKGRAQELEGKLADAQAALKNYEGIDPVKMRQLLKQQEEAEVKAAEARGEYDRLLKQMGERHTEEKTRLEQLLSEKDAKASTLEHQIAELTVGNSFSSSQFVSKDLTLTPTKARVIYGTHFEFKDGKVVGYDKPAGASERTMLVDSVGEPLAFDEALRKLVEKDPDRDQLLRTNAKNGASSATVNKGARKAIKEDESKSARALSPAEKISAGLRALASGNPR